MCVLVLLEQSGELKECALEAASAASGVAKKAGLDLYGVVIGKSIESQVPKLAGLGLKKVFLFEDDSLEHFSSDGYAPVVAGLAKELEAQVIVGSATILGRDLCASVAARLGVELVQDCIGVEWENAVKAVKPIFAGKVLATVNLGDKPQILSLRPNVFPVAKEGDAAPESEKRALPEMSLKSVIKDIARATGKLDLTEAKIVVSGGKGLGGPEPYKMLQELCDVLNAALGASRAAVDAGWIDASHQVGQTGKVVTPDLYIACGISGAIQHLAGMRTSKIIVAINKDPDAPIFKMSDYGIVGDLHEVVPLLVEEVKSIK